MASNNTIVVNMQFRADTEAAKQRIQDLNKSLSELQNSKTLGINSGDLRQAAESARELQMHLNKATNANTGKINLSIFNKSLKSSGTTLQQLANNIRSVGPEGQQAFMQLTQAIASAETPLINLNNTARNFGVTLLNTIKWQIASNLVHSLAGAFSEATSYVKELNEALTDIRIVTGQSTAQIGDFAVKAREAAEALSTTTTEYSRAALIFYQQGLSGDEVMERTNTTIKMAQATGESVETISSQLTAIWNNFYDGSQSLEHYADAITALGAATASSSSEIATGLSKFASMANSVGLSYERATSLLATVVAQTRNSAETVGTSMRTILSRINSLSLGETLEDGVTLTKYSAALEKIGVSILDSNGNLRDMDTILDKLGTRWETLSRDQQQAVAQTVAGIRQVNTFTAMMDNYNQILSNQGIAENSEGTLEKQAKIWSESWEAASKRVKQSTRDLYDEILNDKLLIGLEDGFNSLLKVTKSFIDGFGGIIPLAIGITGIFADKLFPTIQSGLDRTKNSIKTLWKDVRGKNENSQSNMLRSLSTSLGQDANNATNEVDRNQIIATKNLVDLKEQLLVKSKDLSKADRENLQTRIQLIESYTNEMTASGKRIKNLERENREIEAQIRLQERRAEIQQRRSQETERNNNIAEQTRRYNEYTNEAEPKLSKAIREYNNTYHTKSRRSDFLKMDASVPAADDPAATEQQKAQRSIITMTKRIQQARSDVERIEKEITNQYKQQAEAIKQQQKEAQQVASSQLRERNGQFASILGNGDLNFTVEEYKKIAAAEEEARVANELLANASSSLSAKWESDTSEEQKTKDLEALQKQLQAIPTDVTNNIQDFNDLSTALQKAINNPSTENLAGLRQLLNSTAMSAQDAETSFVALGEDFILTAEGLDRNTASWTRYGENIRERTRELAQYRQETAQAQSATEEIRKKLEETTNSFGKAISSLSMASMSMNGFGVAIAGVIDSSKNGLDKTLTVVTNLIPAMTALVPVILKVVTAANKLEAAMGWIGLAIGAIGAIVNVVKQIRENEKRVAEEEAKQAQEVRDEALKLEKTSEDLTNKYKDQTQELQKLTKEYRSLTSASEDYYEIQNKILEAATDQKQRYIEAEQLIKDSELNLSEYQELEKQYSEALINRNIKRIDELSKQLDQKILEAQQKINTEGYNAAQGNFTTFITDTQGKNQVETDSDGNLVIRIEQDKVPVAIDSEKAKEVDYSEIANRIFEAVSNSNGILEETISTSTSSIGFRRAVDVKLDLSTPESLEKGIAKLDDIYQEVIEGISEEDVKKELEDSTSMLSELREIIDFYRSGEFEQIVQQGKTVSLQSKYNEGYTTFYGSTPMNLPYTSVYDFYQRTKGQGFNNEDYINAFGNEGKAAVYAGKFGDRGKEFFNYLQKQGDQALAIYEQKYLQTGIASVDTIQDLLDNELTIDGAKMQITNAQAVVDSLKKDMSEADWTNVYNLFEKAEGEAIAGYDFEGFTKLSLEKQKEVLNKYINEQYKSLQEAYNSNIDLLENPGQLVDDEGKVLNPNSEEGRQKLEEIKEIVKEQEKQLAITKASVTPTEELAEAQEKANKAQDLYYSTLAKKNEWTPNDVADLIRNTSYQDLQDIYGIGSYEELAGMSYDDILEKRQQNYGKALRKELNAAYKQYLLTENEDDLKAYEEAWREVLDFERKTSAEALALEKEERQKFLDLNKEFFERDPTQVASEAESLDQLRTALAAVNEEFGEGETSQIIYEQNLIRLAEQYDNCTLELEAYKAALQSGNEAQQKMAEEALEVAVLIGEAASKYGLSAEEIEIQAAIIGNYADNADLSAEAVARLAINNQRLNKGVTTLNENFEEWQDTLKKSTRGSTDYVKVVNNVSEALKDLIGATDDFVIPDGFLDVEENLELIGKAAKGDQLAINQLGNSLAKAQIDNLTYDLSNNEIFHNADKGFWEGILGESAFNASRDNVISGLQLIQNNLEGLTNGTTTLEEVMGASANQWIKDLNTMAINTKMSVEEMNALLNSMGMDGEIEVTEINEPITTPIYEDYYSETGKTWKDSEGNSYTIKRRGSVPVAYEKIWGKRQIAQLKPKNKGSLPVKFRGVGGGTAGGGISPSSTASKGSSGGSRSKKETKKASDEIERYHKIDKTIDALTKKYSRLSAARDAAFGAQRLKYIERENKLLQQQYEAEKKRLAEVEKYYAKDRGTIEAYGAIIDSNGVISNYEAIMQAQLDKYNSAVNSYNAGSMSDEAFEVIEKEYEEFKKVLSQFEETNSEWLDQLQKVENAIREQISKRLEGIKARVEVELELPNEQLKMIEFKLKTLEDLAFISSERIAEFGRQAQIAADSFDTYAKAFRETLMMQVTDENGNKTGGFGLSADQVDRLLGGNTDIISEAGITGANAQAIMDALKEYEDNLISEYDKLREVRSAIEEEFTKQLEEYNEAIEVQTSKIEKLGSIAKNVKTLMGTVGKEVMGITRDILNSVNSVILESGEAQIDNLRSKYYATEQVVNSIRTQMQDAILRNDEEAIQFWSKQLQEKEQEMLDIKDSLLSTIDEYAQQAKEIMAENIKESFDDMARQLYGMTLDDAISSYDRYKTLTGDYLKDYQKIYELSRLTRNVEKSIDDTNNIKARERLRDLQEEIAQYQADGVRMTQYEVDYLTKKYELRQAEIALYEAQNATDQVRLSRNADGGWGYIYTADQEEIDKAQQNYEDKLYALQQLNQQTIEETQSTILQLQQEFEEAIIDIMNNNELSEEERNKKIAELEDYYKQRMEVYHNNLQSALDNNRELYEEDWRAYNEMTGYRISADEDYVDKFAETWMGQNGIGATLESAGESFITYQTLLGTYDDGGAGVLGSTYNALSEYNAQIKEILGENGLSGNIDTYMGNIRDDIDSAKEAVQELAKELGEELPKTVQKVSNWQAQINPSLQGMASTIEKVNSAIQNLIAALNNLNNTSVSPNIDISVPTGVETTPTRFTADSSGNGGGNPGGGYPVTPIENSPQTLTYKYYQVNLIPYRGGKQKLIETDSLAAAEGVYNAGVKQYSNKTSLYIGIELLEQPNEKRLKTTSFAYLGGGSGNLSLLSTFDTGGYTGTFGPEGRLAMLHEKELVLNKQDTSNMLKMVDIARQVIQGFNPSLPNFTAQTLSNILFGKGNSETNQSITIEAHFPNATNHLEIEEAFRNLANYSAQNAYNLDFSDRINIF